MLSQEEKEKIRGEMVKKLEAAKISIMSLRQQCKPISPDNAIGRISRMDAIQQKSVMEAALRKAEEDQFKLEDALSRISSPDFGLCVRCHQPIPVGRVLALPETRVCVPCASVSQKGGR